MSGISIYDFQVAMETYGATRLGNRTGSRYDVSVPCFVVGNGVVLLHSGSYYIVQRGNKAPNEIMNQAMAVFGEKYPGGKNFWYGEIHSIPGILTLASMLDGKYSKELVETLTNEVYKKLLDNSKLKMNDEIVFKEIQSPKMTQLRNLLAEYASIVNPFGNEQLRLKDPIEYLGNVSVEVSAPDESCRSYLSTGTLNARHQKDCDGWSYNSMVLLQKKRRNKSLHIGHYYNNGEDNRPVDEVIYVDFNDRAESGYYNHPDDVDLRISLKTGLAWRTYDDDAALPATDEQYEIVISFLKTTIKSIKHKIVNKMAISA